MKGLGGVERKFIVSHIQTKPGNGFDYFSFGCYETATHRARARRTMRLSAVLWPRLVSGLPFRECLIVCSPRLGEAPLRYETVRLATCECNETKFDLGVSDWLLFGWTCISETWSRQSATRVLLVYRIMEGSTACAVHPYCWPLSLIRVFL